MTKEYRNYLASDVWKIKREAVFLLKWRSCELCWAIEKLCVHHKTYENVWKEEMEDLQVLCNSCHYKKHNKTWLWFKQSFIKMTMLPKEVLKKINELWPNIVWYIYILTQTLKVGNMIDFNVFEDNWYSKALVDQKIKPILKKNWIVKKRWSSFYLNPLISIKERAVDKVIVDLFEIDNKKIYWIVLK